MVLRRRFEILSSAPRRDVVRVLVNIRNYIEWFSDFIDQAELRSIRSASATLRIPGLPGKYKVSMEVADWIESDVHYVKLSSTGDLKFSITFTITPEVPYEEESSRVRGILEINVGFLWRRTMRDFASRLIEKLSIGINDTLQRLVSGKEVEKRELIKEYTLTLEPTTIFQVVRAAPDPRRLEDIVALASIVVKSTLINTRRISSLQELLNELNKIVEEYKGENIYLVLKNDVTLNMLIEDGVLTGLKIRIGNEEYNGREALERLNTLKEINGTLHIFKVPRVGK